ncbi:MAG: recombination protein RecT [Thiobacillus sp.]|nr:recombination protein RecT [Thiobacillus sp.]
MSTAALKAVATDKAQLAQTARTVASEAGIGNVKAFFESQKSTLAAVLPKHVGADRMLKIALGALRTTPKLMQARTDTLLGAIIQCAQLGLEPNTPLGHAYLIPFENRSKNITEVQIVFGYKGLIDLARRSGQIVSIAAHEVRANDHFEYEYGLDEKLVHRPSMGERGEVIAFYAVAKLVGGGYAFEVMSRADVEAIRNESQGWKTAVRFKKEASSPWGAHFVEMGRKTVLRRLFKFLPVSIELATAATLDGKAAVGETQGAFEDVLQGEYTVATDDGQPGDDTGIDTTTGEIIGGAGDPPAESAAPAEASRSALTADQVRERLTKATDIDVLDADADLIREIGDPEQQAELTKLYRECRAILTGEATQQQATTRQPRARGGVSME